MSTPDSHWAPPPECSTTAHDDLDTAEETIRRFENYISKLEFEISNLKSIIQQHVEQARGLEEQLKVARERTAAIESALSGLLYRIQSDPTMSGELRNIRLVQSARAGRSLSDVVRAAQGCLCGPSISSSVQSHCDGREE